MDRNSIRIARQLVKIARELVGDEKDVVIFDFNDESARDASVRTAATAISPWETEEKSTIDAIKDIFKRIFMNSKYKEEQQRRENSIKEANAVIGKFRQDVFTKFNDFIKSHATEAEYKIIPASFGFALFRHDNGKRLVIQIHLGDVRLFEDDGKVKIDEIRSVPFSVIIDDPIGKNDSGRYKYNLHTYDAEKPFKSVEKACDYIDKEYFKKPQLINQEPNQKD